MKSRIFHLLAAFAALLAASARGATELGWTVGPMASDGSSMRTDGTLVYAYCNPGGTVGGVAFERVVNFADVPNVSASPASTGTGGGSFGNEGVSGDFGSMLQNGWDWNNSETDFSYTLTLKGLTSGNTYLVQMLFHRQSSAQLVSVIDNDTSTTPAFVRGPAGSPYNYGATVVGVFTATGTTKDIVVRYTERSGSHPLNAIQVRELDGSGGGESGGGDEPVADGVARIGDNHYDTLDLALAAAVAGDTVTLLKNVAVLHSYVIDKAITLDLNGFTLTRNDLSSYIQSETPGLVVSNGTVAVAHSLGVFPGSSAANLPLFKVAEGENAANSLVLFDVTVGDTSGYEPFELAMVTGSDEKITISGGSYHAGTLFASGTSTSEIDITGGRFFIRGWRKHNPNGGSDLRQGKIRISGGSFSLAPKASWLAPGYVILHDTTDNETPYHIVLAAEAPYIRSGWSYCYANQAAAEAAAVAKIGDDIYTTLADAAAAAQSGDTILMVADEPMIGKSVTIASDVVLDGNGHMVSVRDPFVDESGYVSSGYTLEFPQVIEVAQGHDVTIRNMHIRSGGIAEPAVNNNGSHGILNKGTLKLENVTITRSNGAILNMQNARLYLDDCRIVRNCRYCAGGLFNKGFAVMDRSSLSENRSLYAEGGGGACENGGTLFVNNCVICNNSSTEIGGAINNFSSDEHVKLYMMNTTVAGNFSASRPTIADWGGGIGLRLAHNHNGLFYSVNSLFCDNYQIDLQQSGEIHRSDVCSLDFQGVAPGDRMVNDIRYSVYTSIFQLETGANHLTLANDVALSDVDADSNVFSSYFATTRIYQNSESTTMPVNGARLVSKDDGSLNAELARYAPILRTLPNSDTPGKALMGTDGVYTYFDASDWKDGVVKMSYAAVSNASAHYGDLDSAGTLVAVGDLQAADADHMVTNYYESATGRSFGVTGASGWLEDEKVYYTVKLAGEVVNGTVTGITLFGDTYEEGTPVTLTATPAFARTFLGWFEPGATEPVTNEATATVWTFNVWKDLILEPRFSEMSELFEPEPKVHVRQAIGETDSPLFPIKVTTNWMLAQYPDIAERLSGKTKEAQEALITGLLEEVDTDTGLKMWHDYVLGIEPGDRNAALWIDSPQYRTVGGNLIRFKMNDLAPVTGSGFTVLYRLDGKLGDAAEFSRGAVNDTGVFDVNVATDPSGLYVIDLIFVPDHEKTSEEFVTSVNTAGVLRVDTRAERAAIAVPWSALAPSGSSPVAAANLVKTMNLTPGDKLYVYDRGGSSDGYKAWELRDNGLWDPLATFQLHGGILDMSNAGDASEASAVARGLGVWLERADVEGYVYLVGQYDGAAVATPVTSGWNLVGNPSGAPLALSGLAPLADGDRIVVPTAGAPWNITYSNGTWGYHENRVITAPGGRQFAKSVLVTDVTVPAGAAFWYISTGSGTLNWNSQNTANNQEGE